MASTMDKVKHALHMDKDKSTTGTTHTHATPGTTGHNTTHGTAEGVAGSHNSKIANAADPRFDSDMDGSRNAGMAHNTHTSGMGHSTGGIGSTGGVGHSTGGIGSTGGVGHSTGGIGSTGGVGHSSGGMGQTSGVSHTGPVHNSKMANELDPRVKTGGGVGGHDGTQFGNTSGNHTTGTTGGISHSTNAGPHNSNLMNKADPMVDSDLSNTGNRHGAHTGGGLTGAHGSHATPGSGTAQNTAGPHNSDMMNKADPRVDADLDGSKTYGGNATHR